MDIKRAQNITKKFIRQNFEYEPILASDWEFKKINSNKIYANSYAQENILLLCSGETYLNKYSFNDEFEINDNKLVGSYYLTSVGFVTEQEYFEAIDFLELYNNHISEKDLNKEKTYISDKGKSYIYLGVLLIETVINRGSRLDRYIDKTKSMLYDIKEQKAVNTSSIRLIKEKEGIISNEYIELEKSSFFKKIEDTKKTIIIRLYNQDKSIQYKNKRRLIDSSKLYINGFKARPKIIDFINSPVKVYYVEESDLTEQIDSRNN